jgi:exopolysaccharide biosynthesis polyprenyl glycosylphosphotransferase
VFRTYQVFWNRLFQVFDACIVVVSFLVAWWLKFDSGWLPYGGNSPLRVYMPAILISVPLFLVANWVAGMYKPMRSRGFLQETSAIVRSLVVGLLLVMSLLYFLHLAQFPRSVLVLFAVIYALLVYAEHMTIRGTLRMLRTRGFNKKFVVVVGWSPAVQRFVRSLEEHPWFGYHVLGCVLPEDATEETVESLTANMPLLSRIGELDQVLSNQLVDHVLISLPRSDSMVLPHVLGTCEAHGVQSLIVPDYFDMLPARPRFETFAGMPLIDTRYVPLDDAVNATLKRVFDVVFSALVLLFLSPLYLAIAVAVKASSRGPIFFRQERIGKNRRAFTMYKFRTMYVEQTSEIPPAAAVLTETKGGLNPSSSAEALPPAVPAGLGWTTPDDPRRTRIGRFLRRTSLDELPQFWNVFIGDMSVIGPRPERPQFVDIFKDEVPKYMVKHRVRPGITGWAQVHGWRGDTSIAERIKFDIDYIENWSWSLDARIFARTLAKGFVDENAY